MTADELRDLAPGDEIHFELRPSGCRPWEVRETYDVRTLGRMVATRQTRPGGGSPTLHAGSHDLDRYHRAENCPDHATRRAS